jgi:hypothetical protein
MVTEGTEFEEKSDGERGKTSTRAVTVWILRASPAGFRGTCEAARSMAPPVVVH